MAFTGVGVALTTLFDERLAVDVAATVDHAVRMSEAGMVAIVAAGTTGEAAALTPEERMALVTAIRNAVPAEVLVVAGTGSASAYGSVALTRQAVAAGADAVLTLSPPGTPDVRPYYSAVVQAAGDTPVLAYHFPNASAPGIPLGALDGIPVAGIKDSSGDPNRLLEHLSRWDLPVYVGNSSLLSLAGPLGATGAILSAANADPETCIAAFAGDAAAQLALADVHAATKRRLAEGIKLEMQRRFGTPTHSRIR